MTNLRSKLALALSRELNTITDANWKQVHDVLQASGVKDPEALDYIIGLKLRLNQKSVDEVLGSYFDDYVPGTINLTLEITPHVDAEDNLTFDATNITYRYRGTALDPDLKEYMGQGPDTPMPDMIDILEAVIAQETFMPVVHNPLYTAPEEEPGEMDIVGPELSEEALRERANEEQLEAEVAEGLHDEEAGGDEEVQPE